MDEAGHAGGTNAAGFALCLSAAHAEIKVGFTAPLSGPVAAVGQDQYDGFMLGIEALGKKLGGEVVTVLREDDQLKPELGNQIARPLLLLQALPLLALGSIAAHRPDIAAVPV